MIFDVYHWRQKMFDGTSETFEMLKRPDTVQIIVVVGDKIWITREQQPGLRLSAGLYGGRLDPGEKPLAAAKRELLEESGLICKDWKIFKIYEPHEKIDWKVYYYIARDCKKVAAPRLDGGEKIKRQAVSFERFINIATAEGFRAGEFSSDLLRMQLDPKKLRAFRRRLFLR